MWRIWPRIQPTGSHVEWIWVKIRPGRHYVMRIWAIKAQVDPMMGESGPKLGQVDPMIGGSGPRLGPGGSYVAPIWARMWPGGPCLRWIWGKEDPKVDLAPICTFSNPDLLQKYLHRYVFPGALLGYQGVVLCLCLRLWS